ncbi:MAG: V-type ATPase subunit [Theionarchaea archaeon]|nr:V-type ATPase subunit [Theionarchaea archaeon]MBU7038428.1 V-type ATPase subunit [Theionarchaea archaeon]
MTGSKYAYAFGRIKALEVGLIDASQLKRMIDARTAQDAVKIVAETSYGTYLSESPDIPEIERAILQEVERTYQVVGKISPEKAVTDLLQLKYDIHNIKILLKSQITGKDLSHLLVPLGREGSGALKAACDGDLKAVSPEVAQIIQKALSLYEESGDFQKVQFFLDREHSLLLSEGFSEIPFLRQYNALAVDLENIRNFIRAEKMEIGFEEVFLSGGTLVLAFFSEVKDQPADYFMESTRNRDFAGVVHEGLTAYQETGSLSRYETLVDNFLMEYMKKAKTYSLSLEPVVGYLFAKEREAKVVRQILISKMKGIDITGRVSDVYE